MNKNPLCKCGCGQQVSKPTNQYIWGHNKTVLSEEGKRKQRERLQGKTYEELYGDRAEEVKKKLWKNREKITPPWKGKTWNEYYGVKKANKIRKKISKKNKNDPRLKDRCGLKNPNYKGAKDSLYIHWAPKVEFDKKRENDYGKIEVECTYCGKWFVPSAIQLDNRINTLKRNGVGGNFYCSDGCKKMCPDHYQVLWPKNYKPYENSPYKNQVEVIPEVRKIVFERDNWQCQKCESMNTLECHHIDPVSKEPFFANDPESCITLCKRCHKEVHINIDGCKYNDLKKVC